MTRRLFASLLCLGAALAATPAPETAPLQPRARERVAPPFAPLAIDGSTIAARDRRCDLSGIIPLPRVGSREVLDNAAVRLDGQALMPPALTWTLRSPGAAAAERRWQHGPWTIQTSYAVDYDGFITLDLTLSPAAPTTLSSLTLDLGFTPAAARLYQVPAWGPTRAGAFPASAEVTTPAPGLWAGAEDGGLGVYVASFRDWHGPGAWLTLARGTGGEGLVRLAVIRAETTLTAPTTWRFGFIATPVITPEPRHWQLYSISATAEDLLHLAPNALIWSGLSDHYATFSTNDPAGDAARRADVERLHAAGRRVLAYTTYAHVEEGDVEVAEDWCLHTLAGRRHAQPVGPGSKARRLYCCPGSAAWVDWKIADLEAAMERYGVDGFYVDTSYVITTCANATHDHGWTDAEGTRHGDFLVWSMREVWRRAWETIAARRGEAAIYAHHKSGCPPALAGFTSAFCDGEQYTGSSIRQLTLDAFQAQDAGGRSARPPSSSSSTTARRCSDCAKRANTTTPPRASCWPSSMTSCPSGTRASTRCANSWPSATTSASPMPSGRPTTPRTTPGASRAPRTWSARPTAPPAVIPSSWSATRPTRRSTAASRAPPR
ncbi:MAG: hypothetical protein GX595_07665, partial [Lentisphaerae bacterium]|nr:hypothetical protein [Lentisphaerota bacterium]